jgi:hypothetical protein
MAEELVREEEIRVEEIEHLPVRGCAGVSGS